jgi:hypothetical protein
MRSVDTPLMDNKDAVRSSQRTMSVSTIKTKMSQLFNDVLLYLLQEPYDTHKQPHCVGRRVSVEVLHKTVHIVTTVDTRQYVASPSIRTAECSFSTPLQFAD